jgi:hypothetical protein
MSGGSILPWIIYSSESGSSSRVNKSAASSWRRLPWRLPAALLVAAKRLALSESSHASALLSARSPTLEPQNRSAQGTKARASV